jgi:hypothetical protein
MKASDIKTLKQLAEQTADPKSILYYNPQPIAKVAEWATGGLLESESWMQLQFGKPPVNVRNWLLGSDVTVCSIIGGSGIYSPHFVATKNAMSFAGDILENSKAISAPSIFLVSTEVIEPTTKDVIAARLPTKVVPIDSTIQGTFLAIGNLVPNKKDAKTIRAAAQLITYINQFVYTFDEYKTPNAKLAGKTMEQYLNAGLQKPGIDGLAAISLG